MAQPLKNDGRVDVLMGVVPVDMPQCQIRYTLLTNPP